jgi:hypothetical protein
MGYILLFCTELSCKKAGTESPKTGITGSACQRIFCYLQSVFFYCMDNEEFTRYLSIKNQFPCSPTKIRIILYL